MGPQAFESNSLSGSRKMVPPQYILGDSVLEITEGKWAAGGRERFSGRTQTKWFSF